MTGKIRTTRSQILRSGWRSSKIIQRTQNCMHPHAVLRTQIRNVLREWQQNQGSTLSILSSQNDKCPLQKTHRRSSASCMLTKSSMRDVNQETITGTLSVYKILPLSGFSFFRTKQRLHMRRKEVCQNSWSRHTSQKSFTLTMHWDLETCEDPAWNHRTSTPHRSETNGIAERAVRRVKEGT